MSDPSHVFACQKKVEVSVVLTLCCSTVPWSVTEPPAAERTRLPPAAMIEDWFRIAPPSALTRIAPEARIFAGSVAEMSWSVAVVVVVVRESSW
ncbi:hypothetical protein [Ralstonia syzygii]|uniref:hypothetical protein n=1 Tax=Ralstonia syzygii TaxID=28097 RepID=UPI0036F257A1